MVGENAHSAIRAARGLLNEAFEIAESVETRHHDENLRAIATAMANIDTERAAEIANRIGSPEHKAAALASLARQLAHVDTDRARALSTQAVSLIGSIDEPRCATEVACDVACEIARVSSEQARKLLDDAVDRVRRARHADEVSQSCDLRRIVRAFVELDVDRALALANTVSDSANMAIAVAVVAAKVAELNAQRAAALFDRALEIAGPGPVSSDDLLALGDPEAILAEAFKSIKPAASRCQGALRDIAICLVNFDPSRALDVAKRAGHFKEDALCGIASALARVDPRSACGLAQEILHEYGIIEKDALLSRLAFDNIYTSTAVSDVATLASVGATLQELHLNEENAATYLAVALAITESLSDRQEQDFALSEIAQSVSRVDTDRAHRLAHQIQDSQTRIRTLTAIAAAVCKPADDGGRKT